MFQDLSKSEREALKAIYRHTKNGADAHTGDLADTLGVTPGTVTATVKRLADRGLVDHRPYHGVSFTDDGRRHAVAAIRRHRIVERFLADHLGYTWEEADRLAPTFEHELPAEIETRMYEVLGQPDSCPHGFPIPRPEQDSIPEMPTLYELDAGATAVVALPSSTDPEIVGFLAELGVRPGVQVEVIEKHPFDGPLVLRVEDEPRTLGERIARRIYVRTTSGADASATAPDADLGGAAGPDDTDPSGTAADGTGAEDLADQPNGTNGASRTGRARTAKPNGGARAARKQKEGTVR